MMVKKFPLGQVSVRARGQSGFRSSLLGRAGARLCGFCNPRLVATAIVGCALSLAALEVVAEIRSTGKVPAVAFVDGKAAFLQGRGAYIAQNYELAIPPLEFSANRGIPLANYYLARIYSDNRGAHADHVKAFKAYLAFVQGQGDVDPYETQRASMVAKAWTALGRYVRDGVPAAGISPNSAKAAEYFLFAAQEYGLEDAQFELAKLRLTGEGVKQSVPRALHWLAVLSRNGHASAQAFLADLFWRGKFTRKDHTRALALISLALRNADPEDRIWIEDLHHNIYCGVTPSTRKSATGVVANWQQSFGRRVRVGQDGRQVRDPYDFMPFSGAERRCGDGAMVRHPATKTLARHSRKPADKQPIADLRPTKVPEAGTRLPTVPERDDLVLYSGAGLSGIWTFLGEVPSSGEKATRSPR